MSPEKSPWGNNYILLQQLFLKPMETVWVPENDSANANRYLSTWFIFDVCSTIPFQPLSLLFTDHNDGIGFKVLNMLRLWRLRRVSSMFARSASLEYIHLQLLHESSGCWEFRFNLLSFCFIKKRKNLFANTSSCLLAPQPENSSWILFQVPFVFQFIWAFYMQDETCFLLTVICIPPGLKRTSDLTISGLAARSLYL